MSDFTKFLNDLENESQQALEEVNNKIKGTGEAIQDSLMAPKSQTGTPVITKNLRNNWAVTVDQEWLDVSGSREDPDDSFQKSKWLEFISNQKLYLSDNIYFNNNVYYGPWVNYGNDQIAAQKFREKAIQTGNEYLRSSK